MKEAGQPPRTILQQQRRSTRTREPLFLLPCLCTRNSSCCPPPFYSRRSECTGYRLPAFFRARADFFFLFLRSRLFPGLFLPRIFLIIRSSLPPQKQNHIISGELDCETRQTAFKPLVNHRLEALRKVSADIVYRNHY